MGQTTIWGDLIWSDLLIFWSPTHLRMVRRCELTIWGWATTNHLLLRIQSKFIQEEHISLLFHHLQDPLKHSHFTWDLEHTLLLKPEFSFGFPQQNPKCLVTQILYQDDEPLQLLPNTHGQKPFWDDLSRKHWTSVCAGESLLEELDALAAIVGGGSRALVAIEVKWLTVGACCGELGVGGNCRRWRVWKKVLQNDIVLTPETSKRHRFDAEKKKFNWTDQFVRWTGRTTSSVGPILVQPIFGLIDLIRPKPWSASPIWFLKPCWKLQVFCHHFVRKLCFFQVVFGGAGKDSRVHENQGTWRGCWFMKT